MPPKKFTPKRKQSADQFRRDAVRRLENKYKPEREDDWEPEKEPVVTPMLKAVEGGIPRVLEALRAHDDDDSRAFLEVYEQCGAKDQQYLPLEYIAHAAGIGSLRLAEVAQTALFLHGQMKTKMILAAGLPAVVEKSLKMAKTSKGLADREWMLKAGNVLPMPKGAQIAIQTNVTQAKAEEKEQEDSPLWLTADQRLRQIHDMTEARRLPAPASEPVVLGGKLDHMQAETAELVKP